MVYSRPLWCDHVTQKKLSPTAASDPQGRLTLSVSQPRFICQYDPKQLQLPPNNQDFWDGGKAENDREK